MQDVKTLVPWLKKNKSPEADTHQMTYRPWGHYEALTQGHRFQVKKIVVKPGQDEDINQAEPTLENIDSDAFLADGAYVADRFIDRLTERGIT